jgi:ribulose-bisphosphate carboxylase large chain
MTRDRFSVIYRFFGKEMDCRKYADNICLEQTVELGDHLVPDGFIRDEILGRVEQFIQISNGVYEAEISYLTDTTAYEFTQFLNLIFGNSSIKKTNRLYDIRPSRVLLNTFKGPRFGIKGLRKLVGVPEKPLVCSALKPMGLSVKKLADLAYAFALGGVDLIKDDHGLSNQPFSPFNERVAACAAAVEKANRKTGKKAIYVPNITAPATQILDRAFQAKKLGAGGVMLIPGLSGFDVMQTLARDDTFGLPVLSHPGMLGPLVLSDKWGCSHGFVFGKLQRLAGADASIYPNYGGRFGFTKEECQQIDQSCKGRMGTIKKIFPMPGGGMSMKHTDDMLAVYGNDVLFLLGGGLIDFSDNISYNVRHFLSLLGRD